MALQDLNALGFTSQQLYKEEYKWREIELTSEFKDYFEKKCLPNGGTIEFGDYSCRLITGQEGKTIDFPYGWFEIAFYFTEYMREGQKYVRLAKSCYEGFVNKYSTLSEGSNPEYSDFIKIIRNEDDNWKDVLDKKFGDKAVSLFESVLEEKLSSETQRHLLIKCLTQKNWSHSGKTIDRGDYLQSGVLNLAGAVIVSQWHLGDLIACLSKDTSYENFFLKNFEPVDPPTSPLISKEFPPIKGKNLIVYGAPGAGKSYYLNQKTAGSVVIRTVFHPEYQNSDFIGGLRPSVQEDKTITYAFVPGPFTKALMQANKQPEKHIYLIVEEINRANAAAVFGEIFQLLDRGENGLGEYTITPDASMQSYLKKEGHSSIESIRLPANLSIFATMNSSDQGVFMLDTAFKRRWEFHYCPIDFDSSDSKPSFNEKRVPYKEELYTWSVFAKAINTALKKLDIEEDRLIGSYFLSDGERESEDSCKSAVAGKLLIYLWDDVLRHGLRGQIFKEKYSTYSDLVKDYKAEEDVFSTNVTKHLTTPDNEDDSSESLKA